MNHVSFDELFITARTDLKSLVQGEYLFQKGDTASHVYTVLDGSVRLVRYSLAGHAISMHTARSGDSFAEASLFSPFYHCDAEAILPSTVACYNKEKVLDILQAHPEKSKSLIALLCRQVRSLRALLEVRSIRSAHDRILHFLLLQADSETMTVNVSGTGKEMAQDLAMAHETFYRTLAQLEKEGKIQRTSSTIKIIKSAFI
jgi:CRP/FNR family transcriptional regulator, dissimilatory nitrate respiration regulator